MPERELVEGYAALLADLYAPEDYYRRSLALVERIGAPAHPTPLRLGEIWVALRAVYWLGVRSPRRLRFWRLLARGLRRGRHAVTTAIACAVRGEHMIRYTVEAVVPRLADALRDIARGPAPEPRVRPRRLPVVDAAAGR
jgi:hypothetical protein